MVPQRARYQANRAVGYRGFMATPAVAGPKIALITGATAGIGAEFAEQLARHNYNLVLVARDAERLAAIADRLTTTHGISVEVLAADLLTAKGRSGVEERVASADAPIDLLVNNAGFGLREPFESNSVDDEQRLLDLLVTVPMRLCHAALGQMLPRNSGSIINIASVAAFTPRGAYGASKAWVVSFSRWANLAYRARGVRVTGVAPGFVRTEFHERMRVRQDSVPAFLWLRADVVVRIALRDAERGKAISIPSARYKVVATLARILPRRLVAAGALKGR
jgi:short-subunit dehydrogenase